MLLERERELKLIDDAMARAADGRGCALVIEGESIAVTEVREDEDVRALGRLRHGA